MGHAGVRALRVAHVDDEGAAVALGVLRDVEEERDAGEDAQLLDRLGHVELQVRARGEGHAHVHAEKGSNERMRITGRRGISSRKTDKILYSSNSRLRGCQSDVHFVVAC